MSATHRLLRFGIFELNLDTEELRKDGIFIKLGPQPLKVLAILTSRSGQIVAREEIRQEVWGEETYVDFEHGLNQCIKQIRTALNDNTSSPLYIETLPRKGYRFLSPVVSKTILAPAPRVAESQSDVLGRPRSLVAARMQSAAANSAAAPSLANSAAATAPELPTSTSSPDNGVQAATEVEPARIVEKPREPATAEPRVHGRRVRYALIVAMVLVAGSIAGVLYWRTHRRVVLTDKDTIVLADFDNNTGESVFDGTLRQGLWSSLEQSPFLNILSDQRIAHTMSLMTQPKGAPVSAELARQVCVRTASAATLEGAIARLGTDYVLSLKAVDCRTGDEIAVEQITAKKKEEVLPALGKVASRIRQKLGEPHASLQKYDVPLSDVTTPSLEALQAYTQARKAALTSGSVAALPLYKQAVELDPNFALAYTALAVEYANLGQVGRAAENARKAYELRAKVSERERFVIDAFYRLDGTGELDKAAEVYEQWQQAYPRDYVTYAQLSDIYLVLANWEKSLTQGRAAIQLLPTALHGYVNAGAAYLSLNRFDEAENTFKQAEEHGLWSEGMLVERYQLAFLKGDSEGMARLAAGGKSQPVMQDLLEALPANTDAWYGKLKSARERTERAMDSAQRNDATEAAAGYQSAAAVREVEFGNLERGKNAATAAVRLAPNRDVKSMAAVALARAGDTAAAEKLADELNKAFPLDTLVQKYWLPATRAAVALQRKDPNHAIEALGVSSPIELSPDPARGMYPAYLRGQAYLMLRDGKAAAAEFQKFIDHRGVVADNPLGALARLGLARAYNLQSDTDKARAGYQDFLVLWKDADPDIPIYQQAKAEYAKLK